MERIDYPALVPYLSRVDGIVTPAIPDRFMSSLLALVVEIADLQAQQPGTADVATLVQLLPI